MAATAQWPPVPNPRIERVTSALQDAIARYHSVLDSDAPFRAITIEIKMKDDGSSVRTVLISFQGDTDNRPRG